MKSVDYEKIAFEAAQYFLSDKESYIVRHPQLAQYCNATLLKMLHKLQAVFAEKHMQNPGTYINFGTGGGFLEFERPDIDTVEHTDRLDHFSPVRNSLKIKTPERMTSIVREEWSTTISKRYDYATCIRFSPVEFAQNDEELNIYLDRIFTVADNIIIQNFPQVNQPYLWIEKYIIEDGKTRVFQISKNNFFYK